VPDVGRLGEHAAGQYLLELDGGGRYVRARYGQHRRPSEVHGMRAVYGYFLATIAQANLARDVEEDASKGKLRLGTKLATVKLAARVEVVADARRGHKVACDRRGHGVLGTNLRQRKCSSGLSCAAGEVELLVEVEITKPAQDEELKSAAAAAWRRH